MRRDFRTDRRGLRARRGAALPLTLFIIVMLTTLAAGAFTMIGSERRVNDDSKAQLDAYVLARRGLEQFVGSRSSLGFTSTPPAAVESTTIALPGGFAEVVMRQVRPPVDSTVPGLYLVRARGFKTVGGSVAGNVTAQRTVAEYARFQYASLEVTSAWTAMAGLQKNGGSGTLSGADACGAKASVAGVAVPHTPGYTQSGGGSVPSGSPNIKDLGTAAQTVDAVQLDWAGIVSGSAVQADIDYPGGTWPSSTDFADSEFWPVIRAQGDFSIPADGKGTLIVTGNLTMSGSIRWRGIILVGGALISNGNNTVDGAVISGLNTKLGMSVPVSDVGNGTKTYRYNSCDVASAVNGFRGLVPYHNAGADNLPSY